MVKDIVKITDPIIPVESIGRLKLGGVIDPTKLGISFTVDDDIQYGYLLNGSLCIDLSLDCIVIGLKVLKGYKGALMDRYYIGQKVSEVLHDASWDYSETDGGIINNMYPGLILYPEIEDATQEEISICGDRIQVTEISMDIYREYFQAKQEG